MKLSKTQRAVLERLTPPDMHLYTTGGFYYPKGQTGLYGERYPAQTLIVLKRKGLIEFTKHGIVSHRARITDAGRAALAVQEAQDAD